LLWARCCNDKRLFCESGAAFFKGDRGKELGVRRIQEN